MRSQRRLWTPIAALSACCALASGYGCGRTVLVSDDSPMRIGPGTTGKAYQLVEGEWRLGAERITYPEGWYVVPPRFVDPDDLLNGGGP